MTETTMRSRPTGRLAQLLDAMAADRRRWTTSKAFDLYRRLPALAGMPLGKVRTVARGDLRDLAAWGWLAAHDDTGRLEYTLNTTTGEPS